MSVYFLYLFSSRQEIGSLPGVCRWGADSVLDFLRPIVEAGLSSVLLFGVPANLPKVKRSLSYLEFLFRSFAAQKDNWKIFFSG
jgi:delta-aminolevulinic acid dehydratase/porphobilinogen synthase